MAGKLIDLHMHSTFSDGTESPNDLLSRAAARGLSAISITDHDTVEAHRSELDHQGVELISGVELSVSWNGKPIHLLGYGFDASHIDLQDTLQQMRLDRKERGVRMLERLRGLSIEIDEEIVLNVAATGAVGRPHIARALIEVGVVQNVQQAFDEYLSKGGKAYVPKQTMDIADGIKLLHAAGGVAVLAHPGLYKGELNSLDDLRKLGLDGIEVYYPEHSPALVRKLEAYAGENRLLTTGGSDFHDGKHGAHLGSMQIDYAVVELIKEKCHELATSR